MSLSRVIAPALLTAGLAFGTYEAIHEVAELNVQADRIAACAPVSNRVGAMATTLCREQSSKAIAGEASSLRDEAYEISVLGILGLLGASAGGLVTLGAVTKETGVLEWLLTSNFEE